MLSSESFVLDCSMVTAWCFADEQSSYTIATLEFLMAANSACAPRMLAYEVRNSVLMGVRRKRITIEHAKAFLSLFRMMPIQLIDPPSYEAVFDLAGRTGLTVYDASYVDLAIRRGLPIAGLDRLMLNAALDAGVRQFRPG